MIARTAAPGPRLGRGAAIDVRDDLDAFLTATNDDTWL
jgi:hypothetical protein